MLRSLKDNLPRDAAGHVIDVISDNYNVLWRIFKPYCFFAGLFYFYDAYASGWYANRFISPFVLGSLTASLFLFVFQLRWFSYLVDKKQSVEKLLIMNLNKTEIQIIGLYLSLLVGFGIIVGIFSFFIIKFVVSAFPQAIPVSYTVLSLNVIFVCLGTYFYIRSLFYIIAKLANHKVSFFQAFSISDGYVLKMFLTYILLIWKKAAFFFLYLIVVSVCLVLAKGSFLSLFSYGVLTFFLVTLPSVVYFAPLFSAYFAVVVMYYYFEVMKKLNITEKELLQG